MFCTLSGPSGRRTEWRGASKCHSATHFSQGKPLRKHGGKAGLLGFSLAVGHRYHRSYLPPMPSSGQLTRGRDEKERMDLGFFGWREAVWLVALLLEIYLIVSLLGLARLRRRRARAPVISAAVGEPGLTVPPPVSAAPVAGIDVAVLPVAAPEFGVAFEAELSARLVKTELEAEVRQLKVELAALREELAELKVTRRVSPLYAEAAALAQRGFDARGVAEECGISVAEAELVLAMSRDNTEFDREVDDGADRQ